MSSAPTIALAVAPAVVPAADSAVVLYRRGADFSPFSGSHAFASRHPTATHAAPSAGYNDRIREERASLALWIAEPPRTYGDGKPRKRRLAEVGATLRPGQKGTKGLSARFGAQLLCVRYRYDSERCVQQITVELLVSERRWRPLASRIATDEIVGVAIRSNEFDLIHCVREAGGWWNPVTRQWRLRLDRALALGLFDRVRRLREPKPDPRNLP